MSKNNFVIARDSERFYDGMIKAYKEWLLNEKNNDNEYYTKLYKLFDNRKNEDNEDYETKLRLIDDIVKMIQERELKRRHIAERCIKNINFLRQKFGLYFIELEDQSIKVGPSEQKVVFENKENYDDIIIEYKSWVNNFEAMVKERELKRLDIAKACLNNINNLKKLKNFGI
ncbi:12864_t:CDS:2 [Gigaspora margarita]|uniref:12864_t:CDS:1 n=1 Tax=Gigaspora margarita TaxID=4874 RepID=A0ABN7UC92_GIGMA|nr:12864_t:CDS:2 [Gigaspora margarita]